MFVFKSRYEVNDQMMRRPNGKKKLMQVLPMFVLFLAVTGGIKAFSGKEVLKCMKDALVGLFTAFMGIMFGVPLLNSVIPGHGEGCAALVCPGIMSQADAMFRKVREELLKDLSGDVIDIGCCNSPYLKYGKGKPITSWTMLEPNKKMRKSLEKTIAMVNPGFPTPIVHHFVEDVKDKFDWIILGNVLCEIPDFAKAVKDCKSLLKPGGKIYFSEHVLAKEGSMQSRIQKFLAPWWVRLSYGCNVNRRSTDLIRDVFGAENVISWQFEMEPPVKTLMPFELGIATLGDGKVGGKTERPGLGHKL